MWAVLSPWRMNCPRPSARPRILGRPPRPSPIAHRRLDFPVPFGPSTRLCRGPAYISTSR
eukprot:scaffold7601_cov267-Pinguiococcus_pyrenoidosus.AAC.5